MAINSLTVPYNKKIPHYIHPLERTIVSDRYWSKVPLKFSKIYLRFFSESESELESKLQKQQEIKRQN